MTRQEEDGGCVLRCLLCFFSSFRVKTAENTEEEKEINFYTKNKEEI